MVAAVAIGWFAHATPTWQDQVMEKITAGCLPVISPVGTAPDGARLEALGKQILADAKARYAASGGSEEMDFELHIDPLPAGAIQEFNADARYVGTITFESCLPGAE